MTQLGRTSEKAEYSCAVHFYTITYGPLQGGGDEKGCTGGDEIVITGGHLSDGGKGDGGDSGGSRTCWDERVKEGVETEDSRIWGNGRGYNVA